MIEKIFPILGFMTHVYTVFLILVKKRKKNHFLPFSVNIILGERSFPTARQQMCKKNRHATNENLIFQIFRHDIIRWIQ